MNPSLAFDVCSLHDYFHNFHNWCLKHILEVICLNIRRWYEDACSIFRKSNICHVCTQTLVKTAYFLNYGNTFTGCIRHNNTYGEITTIEWMDNKSLISQMNYSWNPIACLQGGHWSRDEITAMIVFNCPVVITFLNILRNNKI